jgi:alkylhydroperoxidase family enzyme
MTARITSAESPFSTSVQETLDRLMPPGVAPLALFTMLARDERLFTKFMNGGLLDKGNLTLRQREIVICRVTAQCGSEYEWGVHTAFFADKAGLGAGEFYSLVHGGAGDPCWTNEREAMLIRLCDALHESCSVSDELWGQAAKDFTSEALLEIIMLAGFYRTVSYLTNATCLPLESFAARFPVRDE